jgi:hypothetical protein
MGRTQGDVSVRYTAEDAIQLETNNLGYLLPKTRLRKKMIARKSKF